MHQVLIYTIRFICYYYEYNECYTKLGNYDWCVKGYITTSKYTRRTLCTLPCTGVLTHSLS